MSLTLAEKVRLGAATPAELESLSADDLFEIKTNDDHTHYRGNAVRAIEAPAGYAKDRKVLRLVASTNDKDYYGDSIEVTGGKTKTGEQGAGWKIDDYNRQGGVYLWSHNLGSVKAPIGQALKTWKGRIGIDEAGQDKLKAKTGGQTKKALLQDVEFLSADDGPDDHFKFAETIYLLMSGKGTRSGKGVGGSSVGFIPTKWIRPENAEEREKLGLGPWGIKFLEQTLLENSATPTPANPFASVIPGAASQKAKGAFERTVLEELKFMEAECRHLISPTLVRFFRERAVLGHDDAAEKLEARVRSRVFIFDDVAKAAGFDVTTGDATDCLVVPKAIPDETGEVEEPADRGGQGALLRALGGSEGEEAPEGAEEAPEGTEAQEASPEAPEAGSEGKSAVPQESAAFGVWNAEGKLVAVSDDQDDAQTACPEGGSWGEITVVPKLADAEKAGAPARPEIRADRGEDEVRIVIDGEARSVIERAYDAADLAMATLGAILDATESKTTDPEFESSLGGGTALDQLVERLDKVLDRLETEPGEKATSRTGSDQNVTEAEGDESEAEPTTTEEAVAKTLNDLLRILSDQQ